MHISFCYLHTLVYMYNVTVLLILLTFCIGCLQGVKVTEEFPAFYTHPIISGILALLAVCRILSVYTDCTNTQVYVAAP